MVGLGERFDEAAYALGFDHIAAGPLCAPATTPTSTSRRTSRTRALWAAASCGSYRIGRD